MKYANAIGWTDITPFEVVRIVSDKCLEVRAMSAELDPTWAPVFHVGGFVANCSNNNQQRWVIASDENGRTVRIRLQKNGQWKSSHGERFKLSDEPVKHYDYNF